MAFVLADHPDDVLSQEAASLGATYIIRPDREEDLVQVVLELLAAQLDVTVSSGSADANLDREAGAGS